MRSAVVALCIASLALAAPSAARAVGSSEVAALQVALSAKGLYAGTIDGVAGPATSEAVRRFQQHAGLRPDGVVGLATRRRLGRHGLPELGRRQLRVGAVGWDVSRLQFLLAWQGFPSGTIDGGYGTHVERAVRRYQRWAGMAPDGVAGAGTIASLLHTAVPRSPLRLAWPLHVAVGDGFGPRGNKFHPGIDLPAAVGTGVAAAGPGRIAYAGWMDGYGLLVVVAHRAGVRTFYAHLSRAEARVGQRVAAGYEIGRVGTTGESTGPHLHFEVRVRGAAVDPLAALG
jgi:peptidoglycan hydrolase-like protein with peptidoglycan-binding domain